MKKSALLLVLFGLSVSVQANQNYILRYTESEPLPRFLARYQLVGQAAVPGKPIYLVRDPLRRDPAALVQRISNDTDDDVSIEVDQIVNLPIRSLQTRQASGMTSLLDSMSRRRAVPFFGMTAPEGVVTQLPIRQVRANTSWTTHGLGSGIVAVIDTGVDVSHPFFAGRIVGGFDLLTAGGSGSELTGLPADLRALINPTTTPLLAAPRYLSNGSAAFFEARVASSPLVGSLPIGLGHGTMVAGAVRLVAPNARIMPIRAFHQNGLASLFTVIQSMHMAQARGAKVINLSMNTVSQSTELVRSVDELSDQGTILVASTGNDSRTNPACYLSLTRKATGIASVDSLNRRSLFSNAGVDMTWVAAPGEAMLLPYPGNRWAGGWGTSFSAPLVSGLAAKVTRVKPQSTYSDLQSILGKSRPHPDVNLGLGTLDVFESMAGL